jgi:hypothetical protein
VIVQAGVPQECSIAYNAVRKMVSQPAKLESKFSREAAAVAQGSAVAAARLKLHGNTPDFLNHSFQLLRCPYLHRRIVKNSVRCGRVRQGDQHAGDIFHVH